MPIEVLNLIMRATVENPSGAAQGAEKSTQDPASADCGSTTSNPAANATTTREGGLTQKGVSRYFRRAMEQNKER